MARFWWLQHNRMHTDTHANIHMHAHVGTFVKQSKQSVDYTRKPAHSSLHRFSRPILLAFLLISSVRPLTSAEASHAHVVGRHHLLLDGEVVPLQRVEGRVPQDDSRVFALVLQRQQFLRADGMKCLVRLCDEAGL